jgi:hypothetical protein
VRRTVRAGVAVDNAVATNTVGGKKEGEGRKDEVE